MGSWREDATPEAQEQLDVLLNVALGFAQHELAERSEFIPYAAAIGTDGEPEMIAARPRLGGEQPLSADVIASCVQALVDRRDQIRAAAVVADVSTSAGDAIRVDLEHSDGHALRILLPYSRQRSSKGVEYGEIQAPPGRAQVWSGP